MADELVSMRVLINGWGVDDYHVAGEVIAVPIVWVEIFELCGYARRVAGVIADTAETAGARHSRSRTRSRLPE
jgi:hypothetical protein